MIALDNTAKIGKSPKKPQVDLREDSDESEQDSNEDTMDTEAQELESADRGLGSSEGESEEDESGIRKADGNPGWADAMQKILRVKKPKRKKTIVLSKAKKLCSVVKKEEEDSTFEVEKVKDEAKAEEEQDSERNVQKPVVQSKERRKDNLGVRVKPCITDRERERMLQKVATKGVIQLFNAVRQQQGEINKKLSEAGPLERKREKVLKNIDKCAFLDVLMGGSKSIRVDNDVKNEGQGIKKDKNKEDNGVWNVLRDDFVMGTKLKDWDRKSEDDDSSAPEDMDSDN